MGLSFDTLIAIMNLLTTTSILSILQYVAISNFLSHCHLPFLNQRGASTASSCLQLPQAPPTPSVGATIGRCGAVETEEMINN